MKTELAAGIAALKSGRYPDAVAHLRRASLTSPNDAVAWFGLAFALEQHGDMASAEGALDQVLLLDPKNVVALVLRADQHLRQHRSREAHAYYRAAVSAADQQPNLPPAAEEAVARARLQSRNQAAAFRRHFLQGLEGNGFRRDASPGRLNKTIDHLLGVGSDGIDGTHAFPQAPTVFKYFGLPHYYFADSESWAWVRGIEAQVDVIAQELQGAASDRNGFSPYLVRDPKVPSADYGSLQDSPEWTALFLVRNGLLNQAVADRFPRTLAVLQTAPLHRLNGRAPSILFSRLTAGAHIPPHHGMLNTRLICHLPIIVPGNGALRVGSETRSWTKGKCLIFDDSIQHEAWNRSESERIVLLFEIWRPELGEQERDWIRRIFEISANANEALRQPGADFSA